MVVVNFWAGLRSYTNGREKVNVEAKTVGEVIRGVSIAFPDLSDYLEDNVSVVVDGLFVASLHEPVSKKSEVWLIKRVTGG
tara:strand:+ start:55 stop:297 length:243 start_codon:yes stop_codon:yes gene_type:complete